MGRLDKKVAIVTGGGGGIGKGTAMAFIREGAKVALLEINREAGKKAENEIRNSGGDGLFIETDCTDEQSVRRSVAEAVACFGTLNTIVNIAGGSSSEDRPVHEMDVDYWMRAVKINLLCPFLVSKHGIPHLIEAGGGTIINITSVKGKIGMDRPIYSACKGGIIAFTRTMAAQYAQSNIRVNALLPGAIATERSTKQQRSPESLATMQKRRANYPFGTGLPEDVAGAMIFLASDESRMFTGTTLVGDGGLTAYLNLT